MQYVDKAYYKDTYKGIILTDDNADRYLTIASRQDAIRR
nr:MAG TPA: putative head-tail connector protein [Caudoviricetes sp.]